MMQVLSQSYSAGVTKHMHSQCLHRMLMVTYEDVAAVTVCVCRSSMHQKATEILQNRLSV